VTDLQTSDDENIQKELFTSQQTFSVVHQELHAGPLPPAIELQRYKEIDPTFPSIIIDMAQKYQNHEMQMGKSYADFKKRGQNHALIVVISSFILTSFLAYIGQPLIGGIISFSSIATIAVAFIYGERVSKNKD
jgi:uncharacterized membrane protein